MQGINLKTGVYYLVGAYVAYMAFCIMNNRIHGDDTMTWPVAILCTAVLGIGAVSVIVYAVRRTKKDSENQSISDCHDKH